MKKVKILALMLMSAAVLTGCHKDKDDDPTEKAGSEIAASTSVFSATIKNSDGKADNFSGKSAKYSWGNPSDFAPEFRAVFYGKTGCNVTAESGKNKLTVYWGGSNPYVSSLSVTTSLKSMPSSVVSSAIEKALKGGSLSEDEKTALEEKLSYIGVCTYQIDGGEIGSNNFYYSTAVAISIAVNEDSYITGSFSAKLKNVNGDTFSISDGVFNVQK